MKILLFGLSLMFYFACNPSAISKEEKSTNTTNGEYIETLDGNSIQEIPTTNTGEVKLKLRLLDTYESKKEICGIPNSYVVMVEVLEVLKRGRGIVHMPLKKDQVLMHFMLEPKDLPASGSLEVLAQESPCKKASESYFTIISHKMVD